jgi:pilus assembly protein Flp/PilA
MLNYVTTHLESFTKQLRRDDRGASLVEYGLLIALIAVASIGVLTLLGPAIADMFQTVLDAIVAV